MKATYLSVLGIWMTLAPPASAQSALDLGSLALVDRSDYSLEMPAEAMSAAAMPAAALEGISGRVIEVPSDGIEAYMPIATGESGLPATIQGIWWMDGNPIGDILVTLGSSRYDPATRTAFLTTGDEGSYSFRTSVLTRQAYEQARDRGYGYVLQFDPTFQQASLTPSQLVEGKRRLVSERVVKFTMRYVEDGHWIRESSLFGVKIPDYHLRRVVRPDGVRDPAYADYLKHAGEYSYLLGHF